MRKLLLCLLAGAMLAGLALPAQASVYGGIKERDALREANKTPHEQQGDIGGVFTAALNSTQPIYYTYEWDTNFINLGKPLGYWSERGIWVIAEKPKVGVTNRPDAAAVNNIGYAPTTEGELGRDAGNTAGWYQAKTDDNGLLVWDSVPITHILRPEKEGDHLNIGTGGYVVAGKDAKGNLKWYHIPNPYYPDTTLIWGSKEDGSQGWMFPDGTFLSDITLNTIDNKTASEMWWRQQAEQETEPNTTPVYSYYDPNTNQTVICETQAEAEQRAMPAWFLYLQNHDPASEGAHPDSLAWAELLDPKNMTQEQIKNLADLLAAMVPPTDLARNNLYKDYLASLITTPGSDPNPGLNPNNDFKVTGSLASQFGGTDLNGTFDAMINLQNGTISDANFKILTTSNPSDIGMDFAGASGSATADGFNINQASGWVQMSDGAGQEAARLNAQGATANDYGNLNGSFNAIRDNQPAGNAPDLAGTLSGGR